MFTKEELNFLQEVVNMAPIRGEHVELVYEVKKKLQLVNEATPLDVGLKGYIADRITECKRIMQEVTQELNRL